jgi:hypothetical protein
MTHSALATKNPKANGDRKGDITKPIVQMFSYGTLAKIRLWNAPYSPVGPEGEMGTCQ